MKHHLHGKVSKLDQINTGDCILFGVSNQVHLGIVVQTQSDDKFILDLDYLDQDGNARFQIYDGANFINNPMIVFTNARIVPKLDKSAVGVGIYGQHVMSRALFVTELGPVVYASAYNNVHKINLADGSVYRGDMNDQFHTTLWFVEIETGDGEFQTLREFKA